METMEVEKKEEDEPEEKKEEDEQEEKKEEDEPEEKKKGKGKRGVKRPVSV